MMAPVPSIFYFLISASACFTLSTSTCFCKRSFFSNSFCSIIYCLFSSSSYFFIFFISESLSRSSTRLISSRSPIPCVKAGSYFSAILMHLSADATCRNALICLTRSTFSTCSISYWSFACCSISFPASAICYFVYCLSRSACNFAFLTASSVSAFVNYAYCAICCASCSFFS